MFYISGEDTDANIYVPYFWRRHWRKHECCLRYATFYNRHTVTIVEQLLCGDNICSATKGDRGNGNGKLRKLDQIRVPEEYVGKTFKDAFVGMLVNGGMMALGLYRALGTSGSIVSFVYTNPSPSTILFHDDLIYAICWRGWLYAQRGLHPDLMGISRWSHSRPI